MPPWKPAPKPIPATAVPAKKPCGGIDPDGEQHDGDARDQRGGADQHHVGCRRGPEHVGGQRGDAGQDAEAQSGVDDRGGADEVVDQARSERAIEPGEGPHGEEHRGRRRASVDGSEREGRSAGRSERHAPGARGLVSGSEQHAEGLHHQHPGENDVHQTRRRREPLHGERRQRARRSPFRGPAQWRWPQHRAPGSMSSMPAPMAPMAAAGAKPCTIRADEKRRDAVGIDEDQQGQDLTGDAGEQHRAPSDVIGEPSDGEQS